MSGFGNKYSSLLKLVHVVILLALFSGIAVGQSSRSESDFIYAKRLYDDGLYDLAAEALENYLATYSDSPHRAEASMLVGEARWNEDDFETARTAFQNVAMNYPNDPRAVDALFRVADCYSALGDREKNIRALLRIPVFYPGSVEAPIALVRAAELLINANRWADAESPLQQVIQQYIHSPQVIDARMLWAKVLANRGDLESAIDESGRVAGQTDDIKLAVEALGLQGEWYSQLGRDAEAEASWQKILTDYPGASENASALIRMAERRLRIGDAEQAEPLFRQALDADLNQELIDEANLGLGDALFILERYEASLAFYNKISLDTDEISFRKALAFEYNGQLTEALLRYEDIVETSENNELVSVALWRSGTLLEQQSRYREAASTFERAEIEYGDDLFASESAYRNLQNLQKLDSADLVKKTEEFLDKYPKSSKVDDVAWMRIDRLIKSGDNQKALDELNRYKINYPLSGNVNIANEKIEFIQKYMLKDGDPASKVTGLLAEVAGGLDRNNLSRRLGEIYLNEYKDFSAAEQQFRIVLSDSTISKDERREVNVLLAESLWRKYEFATYSNNGEKVPYDGNEANTLSGELISILYEIDDPADRANIAYHIINLGLETRIQTADKIRYKRNAWQAYLADHPSSPHNAEILYELAESFTYTLEEDTVGMGEDPSIWYLGTIINEYPESEYFNKAHLKLSERYRVTGDSLKSVEYLRYLLDIENSPEKIEATLELLQTSVLSVQELEKYINWLQYDAFYNPELENVELILLDKLIEMENFEKALVLINKIEDKHPEMGAGLVIKGSQVHKNAFLKGLIYEGLDLDDKAKENYQLYLAFHPDDESASMAHLRLALMRKEMGYTESAMSHYKWLLSNAEVDSIRLFAFRGASLINFEKGNYEEARRWAENAEMNDPELTSSIKYGEIKIVTLLKMGRLNEANSEIKIFKAKYDGVAGIDNSESRFLLEKGKYLSKVKNYRESADIYRRLYKKYPNTDYAAEAKYELGRDYLELKKYDEALDILTAMPTEYPGHPIIGKVYWVLGNYYVSNNNVMDGISTYDKVLNDSTYSEVWPFVFLNQIRAYKQAGFYAGGLQTVQRYLELYPNASDTFDRQMDIGTMYQQLGQYDLAISQFRKIQPIANVEDEAACQFYIAESLEKSGRLAEAVIEYKKVDYLGKRTKMQWAVTALYSAGRVLERLGENENAIDMYGEIVKREGLGSPFGRKAQEQILRIEKAEEE